MTYQSFEKYNGSMYGKIPQAEFPSNGLEFDWEVPDNKVITSPGGASSTQHHWTKGFYGKGGSSWDVYAGQASGYPYGVYKNLYTVGDGAGYHLGSYEPPVNPIFIPGYEPIPPPTLTNKESSHERSHESSQERSHERSDAEKFENFQSSTDKVLRENYEPTDSSSDSGSSSSTKVIVSNPLFIFLIVIGMYFAFYLWGLTLYEFFKAKVIKGEPTWKQLLIYSVIFTVGLFIVGWLSGIPTIKLEKL